MRNRLIFFFLISLGIYENVYSQDTKESPELCNCPSQSKLGKGTFYFAWGYNKDYHSKSDLHFKNSVGNFNPVTNQNETYDFTLYDVKAKDLPGFEKIINKDLAIPQYNYRLGYYFNDKHDLGIEIGFDHTKYIMLNGQNLHLKGTINGKYYDQDTVINGKTFLAFEHTNGANFLMVSLLKRQHLLVSKNKKHWLSAIFKAGGGMVIPKTDVTLFGQRLDNRFHIAGYILGVETSLRYDAFKHVFLEYSAKGTWANYMNVLVIGNGKAHHNFFTLQNVLVLGYQFPI